MNDIDVNITVNVSKASDMMVHLLPIFRLDTMYKVYNIKIGC